MIDCLAGYHLNPWCGIAKFNATLAKHLALPVVGIKAVERGRYRRPLLSIELSEFTGTDARFPPREPDDRAHQQGKHRTVGSEAR
jgi:hypothetical protein